MTPSGQKSLSFLPDIPYQRNIQIPQIRDKNNASSMNYRMTATDASGSNPFMSSIHGHPMASSNSSSPSTKQFSSTIFQDSAKFANKECKNIRNYHHLYELHMSQRMKGLKERERLGVKKVWLFEKLPPLESGIISKSDNQPRFLMKSLNQQQIMKTIQRDPQGQIIGINQIQKQSSMVVDSALKQEDLVTTQTSNFVDLDTIISKTKPVLKKSMLHQNNTAYLTFKSVEIYFVEEDNDKQKIHSPIYVPPNMLKELMNLSKGQLEIKIMENISFDSNTNTFIYQYQRNNEIKIQKRVSPRKSDSLRNKYTEKIIKEKVNENQELFPEVIFSSMFVHEKNKDFKVIIKMPTIEYSITSKNFTFIKTLTRSELKEYLDQGFQNWEDILLKHFMQFRKFMDIIKTQQLALKAPFKPQNAGLIINKQRSSETNQKTIDENDQNHSTKHDIYVLDEKDGVSVIKYSSLKEYQKERIFKYQTQLKGCFDRQGAIGRIKLRSFILKIKGLSNEYEFKESIKFEDWKKIIAFMKKSVNKDPEDPQQLVDMISEIFVKMLEKGNIKDFSFKEISKLKKYGDKYDKKDKKKNNQSPMKKKIPQNYMHYQKKSKMIMIQKDNSQDRYLLEFEFPTAILNYDGGLYKKTLQEGDCEYLNNNKFDDWKKFLMNMHFRVELNINNEPLPRINEVKKEDEDIFSEEDFREKYPPKDEEEKQKIVVTRDKLSQWFPY